MHAAIITSRRYRTESGPKTNLCMSDDIFKYFCSETVTGWYCLHSFASTNHNSMNSINSDSLLTVSIHLNAVVNVHSPMYKSRDKLEVFNIINNEKMAKNHDTL